MTTISSTTVVVIVTKQLTFTCKYVNTRLVIRVPPPIKNIHLYNEEGKPSQAQKATVLNLYVKGKLEFQLPTFT